MFINVLTIIILFRIEHRKTDIKLAFCGIRTSFAEICKRGFNNKLYINWSRVVAYPKEYRHHILFNSNFKSYIVLAIIPKESHLYVNSNSNVAYENLCKYWILPRCYTLPLYVLPVLTTTPARLDTL